MPQARTTDGAASHRAAASIPIVARDKNAPTPELLAAVLLCLPRTGDFTQPQVEALMRMTPAGIRPDNGERWSDQRVRGCLKWLEDQGRTEIADDGGRYTRFRCVTPKPREPQPEVKAVQTSMF